MIPHDQSCNWFTNGFTLSDFDVLTWQDMYIAQMINSDPRHLPFEVTTQIPSDHYVFPIRVDMFNKTRPDESVRRTFLNQLAFTIPDDVLADVFDNKCKILFDGSVENFNILTSATWAELRSIINRTISRYGLQKSHVILVTGNYFPDDTSKFTIAIRNWSDNLVAPCSQDFFNAQKMSVSNKVQRPKKILTFMRKERLYRVQLAQYIFENNLRDQNIVTLGKNVNSSMWMNAERNHMFRQKFLDTLPWHYDIELDIQNDLSEYTASQPAEQQAYLDTYINCVAETFISADKHDLDITEKTFKPIAYLQPFFVFGHPGTLAYLHSRGYKTFGKWWDESYDGVQDTRIKFNMLTNLYKRLSNMSHLQLSDMLCEMWPILEHNYWVYHDYVQSGKSYQHLLKTVEQCFDK
jgi:hypothetical protein